MSKELTASDALALVPGWDPSKASIEELRGGLTNRSYFVRYSGDDFVLRLDSAQSRLFRIDRALELAIMKNAHATGLGPLVVYSDLDENVMLREYLPGRVWQKSDMTAHANLEALAEIIRLVHAMPLCGSPVALSSAADTYQKYLETRQGPSSFASECVKLIHGVAILDDVVCGHNDVVAGNVVENAGLKLIDWEYASDSDPMYDLASAIAFHDLDRKSADILLNAYAGGDCADWRERLADQMRAYDAIQWLWLATRQLVVPSRWQARRLKQLQKRIR